MRSRIIIGLSLGAGGGDLVTGLLLIFAPKATLALMHVPIVNELVFLRFVGCFVATVGLTYFVGLVSWKYEGIARLRTVWELTIAFRFTAGAFVASQVATNALSWPWLSVPFFDGFWCLVQGALLRQGYLRESQDETQIGRASCRE